MLAARGFTFDVEGTRKGDPICTPATCGPRVLEVIAEDYE